MTRSKGQDTTQRTRDEEHLGGKTTKAGGSPPPPQSNTAGPELPPYHAHKHQNPHTGSSSQAALCVQMESCYSVGGATSFTSFHIQSYGRPRIWTVDRDMRLPALAHLHCYALMCVLHCLIWINAVWTWTWKQNQQEADGKLTGKVPFSSCRNRFKRAKAGESESVG